MWLKKILQKRVINFQNTPSKYKSRGTHTTIRHKSIQHILPLLVLCWFIADSRWLSAFSRQSLASAKLLSILSSISPCIQIRFASSWNRSNSSFTDCSSFKMASYLEFISFTVFQTLRWAMLPITCCCISFQTASGSRAKLSSSSSVASFFVNFICFLSLCVTAFLNSVCIVQLVLSTSLNLLVNVL